MEFHRSIDPTFVPVSLATRRFDFKCQLIAAGFAEPAIIPHHEMYSSLSDI